MRIFVLDDPRTQEYFELYLPQFRSVLEMHHSVKSFMEAIPPHPHPSQDAIIVIIGVSSYETIYYPRIYEQLPPRTICIFYVFKEMQDELPTELDPEKPILIQDRIEAGQDIPPMADWIKAKLDL